MLNTREIAAAYQEARKTPALKEGFFQWFASQFESPEEHVGSIFEMAHFYEEINNYVNAVEWHEKAVKLGSPLSILRLATHYLIGDKIQQNKGKALELFKEGDKINYDTCQVYLGHYYFFGCEVKQDYANAVKYYEKAAAHTTLPSSARYVAPFHLAFCYEFGFGVPEDKARAESIIKKTFDGEDKLTKINLLPQNVNRFFSGFTIDKDIELKLNLFIRTAAKKLGIVSLGVLGNPKLTESSEIATLAAKIMEAKEKKQNMMKGNNGALIPASTIDKDKAHKPSVAASEKKSTPKSQETITKKDTSLPAAEATQAITTEKPKQPEQPKTAETVTQKPEKADKQPESPKKTDKPKKKKNKNKKKKGSKASPIAKSDMEKHAAIDSTPPDTGDKPNPENKDEKDAKPRPIMASEAKGDSDQPGYKEFKEFLALNERYLSLPLEEEKVRIRPTIYAKLEAATRKGFRDAISVVFVILSNCKEVNTKTGNLRPSASLQKRTNQCFNLIFEDKTMLAQFKKHFITKEKVFEVAQARLGYDTTQIALELLEYAASGLEAYPQAQRLLSDILLRGLYGIKQDERRGKQLLRQSSETTRLGLWKCALLELAGNSLKFTPPNELQETPAHKNFTVRNFDEAIDYFRFPPVSQKAFVDSLKKQERLAREFALVEFFDQVNSEPLQAFTQLQMLATEGCWHAQVMLAHLILNVDVNESKQSLALPAGFRGKAIVTLMTHPEVRTQLQQSYATPQSQAIARDIVNRNQAAHADEVFPLWQSALVNSVLLVVAKNHYTQKELFRSVNTVLLSNDPNSLTRLALLLIDGEHLLKDKLNAFLSLMLAYSVGCPIAYSIFQKMGMHWMDSLPKMSTTALGMQPDFSVDQTAKLLLEDHRVRNLALDKLNEKKEAAGQAELNEAKNLQKQIDTQQIPKTPQLTAKVIKLLRAAATAGQAGAKALLVFEYILRNQGADHAKAFKLLKKSVNFEEEAQTMTVLSILMDKSPTSGFVKHFKENKETSTFTEKYLQSLGPTEQGRAKAAELLQKKDEYKTADAKLTLATELCLYHPLEAFGLIQEAAIELPRAQKILKLMNEQLSEACFMWVALKTMDVKLFFSVMDPAELQTPAGLAKSLLTHQEIICHLIAEMISKQTFKRKAQQIKTENSGQKEFKLAMELLNKSTCDELDQRDAHLLLKLAVAKGHLEAKYELARVLPDEDILIAYNLLLEAKTVPDAIAKVTLIEPHPALQALIKKSNYNKETLENNAPKNGSQCVEANLPQELASDAKAWLHRSLQALRVAPTDVKFNAPQKGVHQPISLDQAFKVLFENNRLALKGREQEMKSVWWQHVTVNDKADSKGFTNLAGMAAAKAKVEAYFTEQRAQLLDSLALLQGTELYQSRVKHLDAHYQMALAELERMVANSNKDPNENVEKKSIPTQSVVAKPEETQTPAKKPQLEKSNHDKNPDVEKIKGEPKKESLQPKTQNPVMTTKQQPKKEKQKPIPEAKKDLLAEWKKQPFKLLANLGRAKTDPNLMTEILGLKNQIKSNIIPEIQKKLWNRDKLYRQFRGPQDDLSRFLNNYSKVLVDFAYEINLFTAICPHAYRALIEMDPEDQDKLKNHWQNQVKPKDSSEKRNFFHLFAYHALAIEVLNQFRKTENYSSNQYPNNEYVSHLLKNDLLLRTQFFFGYYWNGHVEIDKIEFHTQNIANCVNDLINLVRKPQNKPAVVATHVKNEASPVIPTSPKLPPKSATTEQKSVVLPVVLPHSNVMQKADLKAAAPTNDVIPANASPKIKTPQPNPTVPDITQIAQSKPSSIALWFKARWNVSPSDAIVDLAFDISNGPDDKSSIRNELSAFVKNDLPRLIQRDLWQNDSKIEDELIIKQNKIALYREKITIALGDEPGSRIKRLIDCGILPLIFPDLLDQATACELDVANLSKFLTHPLQKDFRETAWRLLAIQALSIGSENNGEFSIDKCIRLSIETIMGHLLLDDSARKDPKTIKLIQSKLTELKKFLTLLGKNPITLYVPTPYDLLLDNFTLKNAIQDCDKLFTDIITGKLDASQLPEDLCARYKKKIAVILGNPSSKNIFLRCLKEYIPQMGKNAIATLLKLNLFVTDPSNYYVPTHYSQTQTPLFAPPVHHTFTTHNQQSFGPSEQQAFAPTNQQAFTTTEQQAYAPTDQQTFTPTEQQTFSPTEQQTFFQPAQQTFAPSVQQLFDQTGQQYTQQDGLDDNQDFEEQTHQHRQYGPYNGMS